MDANREGRFGRMVLTAGDPPVGIALDLFRGPPNLDFEGHGLVVFSSPDWEEEVLGGSQLSTMSLSFDRATWDMLEERVNLSEEDLPIEGLALIHTLAPDIDVNVETDWGEIFLTASQADPAMRILRGRFDPGDPGYSPSSYSFVLEEFGSPDGVILLVVIGLLILGTKAMDIVAQRACSEEARTSCAPRGVAEVIFGASNEGSGGFGAAGPTGEAGVKVRGKCRYKCASS